jgi:hypothetical protein
LKTLAGGNTYVGTAIIKHTGSIYMTVIYISCYSPVTFTITDGAVSASDSVQTTNTALRQLLIVQIALDRMGKTTTINLPKK